MLLPFNYTVTSDEANNKVHSYRNGVYVRTDTAANYAMNHIFLNTYNNDHTLYVDEIYCWNGTIADEPIPTPPDIDPPILSVDVLDFNVTTNSTYDKNPQFSLLCDDATGCAGIRCSWSDESYTDMSNDIILQNTVNNNWTTRLDMTVSDILYCAATDGTNEHSAATNSHYEITILSDAGDSASSTQYLSTVTYNATHITYNKTLVIANFYGSEKTFDIPAQSNWDLASGTDPLTVSPQSFGYVTYQRTMGRGFVDNWTNHTPITTTTTTSVSNDYKTILPVDPPLKYCQFKTSRELTDTFIECDTLSVLGTDTVLTLRTDAEITYTEKIFVETGSKLNILGGKITPR